MTKSTPETWTSAESLAGRRDEKWQFSFSFRAAVAKLSGGVYVFCVARLPLSNISQQQQQKRRWNKITANGSWELPSFPFDDFSRHFSSSLLVRTLLSLHSHRHRPRQNEIKYSITEFHSIQFSQAYKDYLFSAFPSSFKHRLFR